MTHTLITEMPHNDGITMPRFSVSYGSNPREKDQREKSISLIRKLISGRDCIIEVQSELFTLPAYQREDIALEFLAFAETNNLFFRYSKNIVKSQESFLLKILPFGSDTITAHHIIAHLGKKFFESDVNRNAVPFYGARYHILNSGADTQNLIERMHSGLVRNEELNTNFHFSFFDCGQLGQMGIYSKDMTKNSLQRLLTL